jgi:hypothetical protein
MRTLQRIIHECEHLRRQWLQKKHLSTTDHKEAILTFCEKSWNHETTEEWGNVIFS